MKAIIFDFDGTLADSLPLCIDAFKTVFREFDQKEYTTADIIGMFGPAEADLIKRNLVSERVEEAIERYYDYYRTHHVEYVPENEKMKNMLQFLKNQGYKLGLVTGKSRRGLDYSLAALQMDHLFDSHIAGDEVENNKPDPEGILRALEELGVDRSEAMFLGDSDFDMKAAKDAGVHSVGVHWLPNVQSKVFKVKPDQYFTSIETFLRSL